MDIRSEQEVNRYHRAAGFTIMEVLFAIVILASSLTVILGLQYSSTEKTMQGKYQQQAMLLARIILAEIETNPIEAESSETIPALELIDQISYENPLIEGQDKFLNTIQATLYVEDLAIPVSNSNPVTLKKVILTMNWSENPADSFEIVYFIPNKESNEAPLQ